MKAELMESASPQPLGEMTVTDPGIIAMGQRAEKLVQALKIIRAAVLKLTNEKDWENLGDKPYLNEGGAKKVGTAFGVSWQLEPLVRENHDDGHFDYMVQGEFEFRGTRVEEIGTRSSKDDFFCKARGKEIPPSEIDRNDVKKSAITNCIARGVKSVLALKNFTWEELRHAGIDQAKVSKVEYGQGSNDPNAAMKLPPYGRHKGQALDDPAVPIEELRYYLSGAEKSIADPEKAKYKVNNEKMRDALKAEIAKREQPEKAQVAPPDTAQDGGGHAGEDKTSPSHEAGSPQQATEAPAPLPPITAVLRDLDNAPDIPAKSMIFNEAMEKPYPEADKKLLLAKMKGTKK